MKRHFLYIFLLIFIVGFLVWPKIGLADVELSNSETHLLLGSIHQQPLTWKYINLIPSFNSSESAKQAAVIVIKKAIEAKEANYAFIEIPKKTFKILIKKGASLLLLPEGGKTITTLLDKIEKESIKKATEIIKDWLLQNEVKVASGVLNKYSYKSYKGNSQKPVFGYNIVYRPIGSHYTELIVEFYSPKAIEPPDSKGAFFMQGSYWEINDWLRAGNEKLKPFIIRVRGKVSKGTYGGYSWSKDSKIEVIFDEPVPEFEFSKPSFWDRLKASFNKIKSIFSNLNIFQATIAPEFPSFEQSELDLSEINLENLLPEEKIEQLEPLAEEIIEKEEELSEVVQETKPGAETGLEPVSLEKMQEILDDIAERIDVLNQEVAKLVEESQKTSEEIKEEEEEEEEETEEDEAEQEEEQKEEERKESKYKGGGGGASPPSYPKILISELQISPIKERFVELYNPNDSEVSLTNWYIQRKVQAGTSWNSFVSSTKFEGKTIQPYGYFLIAKSFENADIVFDLTLTENNTLALKNPNRDIVDKVGWGEAQEFETAPAENPPTDQSLGRRWSETTENYIDTDNNQDDFEIQTPTPKAENSQPLGEEEEEEEEEGPILEVLPQNLVFNAVEFSTAPQDGLKFDIINSGKGNLEWTGAIEYTSPSLDELIGYTSPLTDGLKWLELDPIFPTSGTLSDEESFSIFVSTTEDISKLIKGTYIAEITIAADGSEGSEQKKLVEIRLNIRKEEEEILPEDLTTEEECLEAGYYWYNESCHEEEKEEIAPQIVMISEIQIADAEDEKEEFVELYNPDEQEVDLTSWYLQRKTKDAADYSTFAPSTLFSGKSIKAKDYFLIARQDSSFINLADITITYPLTQNNTLVLKNPNRDIVDKIGWGEAQEFETAPAENPPAGQSLGRKWSETAEDYIDTDNNQDDFEIQVPTPKAQNQGPPPPPSFTESPWPMFRGNPQRNSQSNYPGPSSLPTVEWIYDDGSDWNDARNNPLYFSPVIDKDGTVYSSVGFPSSKSGILALNWNGSKKWFKEESINLPLAIQPDGSILPDGMASQAQAKDGAVYYGEGNVLYAFDKDGSKKWEREFEFDNPQECPPRTPVVIPPAIGGNGIIYVVVRDSFCTVQGEGAASKTYDYVDYLYAISPENVILWHVNLGGYHSSSPVISSGGTVYVINLRYGISYPISYLKAVSSGEIKWSEKIVDRGSVSYSLPIIDSQGNIYFSIEKTIYCFDSGGGKVWEMYLKDTPVRWDIADVGLALSGDGTICLSGRGAIFALK